MGALEEFLARHKWVGVDTVVFIYHLEDHPRYTRLTQPLFEAWGGGARLRRDLGDHPGGAPGEAKTGEEE